MAGNPQPTGPLSIPLGLPDWQELNRRASFLSSNVLGRLQFLEDRVTTSFQGTYNQVTDVKSSDNGPLDAATNYQPGDFYTLDTSGVFSTSIPELNGLTGGPGDQIISDGSVWLFLASSTDFISSVIDDEAAGVITFNQVPLTIADPVGGNAITRKSYVDGEIAAHDDPSVHYPQTDIDHTVIQNRGTNTHAQIDTHIADALIHFTDVPIDGVPYNRQDQAWVPAIPSFAYLSGGGITGAWDTTLKTIANYTDSGSTPDMAAFLNLTAGYIEIPADGVWQIQATVVGDQGNSTKEEAMRLWVQVTNHPTLPDADVVLDVFDVATDKTNDRTFAFSYARPYVAGERIAMAVNATASMGTFTFEVTSLEVTRVI